MTSVTHHVCQRVGSPDVSSLGHVPDDEHGDAEVLRQPQQRLTALSDLVGEVGWVPLDVRRGQVWKAKRRASVCITRLQGAAASARTRGPDVRLGAPGQETEQGKRHVACVGILPPHLHVLRHAARCRRQAVQVHDI